MTVYAFWQWAPLASCNKGWPGRAGKALPGRADTSQREAPTDDTIA